MVSRRPSDTLVWPRVHRGTARKHRFPPMLPSAARARCVPRSGGSCRRSARFQAAPRWRQPIQADGAAPTPPAATQTHSLGPTCRSAAAPARPTKVTGVVFLTRLWICPRSGRSQSERYDFRGESGPSCKQPTLSLLGRIDRLAQSAARARFGCGSPGAADSHLRVWELWTELSKRLQQLRSNKTVAQARPMIYTRPVGYFPVIGNTPASCRSTVHAKGASSRN